MLGLLALRRSPCPALDERELLQVFSAKRRFRGDLEFAELAANVVFDLAPQLRDVPEVQT